jgi:hypothetical protein
VRRAVERPRLRLRQDLIPWSGREVADPLAALDEPGEGPQQRDLVGGVRTIAVGHPPRPHHLVPPLPRPEARGGQARELGHLVDLVCPVGSGQADILGQG